MVHLYWEGPIDPTYFIREKSPYCVPGVYAWTATTKSREWLEYIGKAEGGSTIGQRQQEHVGNVLGLRATIPREFRSDESPWVPNQYPDNSEALLDPKIFAGLQAEARSYLNAMSIYVAPMSGTDRGVIRLVERRLLYDYKPKRTKWGTITRPKAYIELTNHSADWLAVYLAKS